MFAPPKPYIGVTGFMQPKEIEALQKLFGPNDSHQLMVGILVSHKTWNGIPSKYPNLFPPRERLQELVAEVDETRAFALIHYNAAGPTGDVYVTREEWVTDEAVFLKIVARLSTKKLAAGSLICVLASVASSSTSHCRSGRPCTGWMLGAAPCAVDQLVRCCKSGRSCSIQFASSSVRMWMWLIFSTWSMGHTVSGSTIFHFKRCSMTHPGVLA